MLHFEDFSVGQRLALAPFHVTAEEIAGFAAEFGSLPADFETPADNAGPAGAAASGWHGCAIFMAMICRGWLAQTAFLGAPGVKTLHWRRPIRAGDRLAGISQVTALRASQSRPAMGFLHVRHTIGNAAGDCVMELHNPMMVARRTEPS